MGSRRWPFDSGLRPALRANGDGKSVRAQGEREWDIRSCCAWRGCGPACAASRFFPNARAALQDAACYRGGCISLPQPSAMSPRHFASPFALACAFMLAAFATPTPASAADKLVWRGDIATGRTIMEDIAKEYAKQKKGTIDLQPFSTLSGLDAVANGRDRKSVV